jgi:hypothetical protein
MKALLLALALSACAALEEQAPALDSAATVAAQTGACLRFVCKTAFWSATPISECRVRPGRCHRN